MSGRYFGPALYSAQLAISHNPASHLTRLNGPRGRRFHMMWFPQLKQRPWYQSPLCHRYGCGGLAARLWGRHLVPIPYEIPANDRDHLRW